MDRLPRFVTVFLGLSLFACTGTDDGDLSGSGGAVQTTGGSVGVGGSPAAVGGATLEATQPAAGGSAPTSTAGTEIIQGGSTQALGGTSSVGSLPATGGTLSTGGATATGGTSATGGKSSTGGTKATGGTSATGGKSSTGGTTATGGKSSTGGTTATGGKSSTGGTTATGGTSATGGKSSTGGTKATGGSSATTPGGCSVTRDGATGNEVGGLIPVCCTPGSTESTSIAEVFAQLNAHRVANGLSALAYDSTLELTIQGHCVHMSTHTFFDHSAPEAVVAGPGERLAICAPARLMTWGENIAQGYSSPTAVMDGWKTSSGHNANMLGKNFTKVGIGYTTTGRYWGQVFGG